MDAIHGLTRGGMGRGMEAAVCRGLARMGTGELMGIVKGEEGDYIVMEGIGVDRTYG